MPARKRREPTRDPDTYTTASLTVRAVTTLRAAVADAPRGITTSDVLIAALAVAASHPDEMKARLADRPAS